MYGKVIVPDVPEVVPVQFTTPVPVPLTVIVPLTTVQFVELTFVDVIAGIGLTVT
jgi:hypothetical protein